MRRPRRRVVLSLLVLLVAVSASIIYLRATAAPTHAREEGWGTDGRTELRVDASIRRMAFRAQLDHLCNAIRSKEEDLKIAGGPSRFFRAYRNDATGEIEVVIVPIFDRPTDTDVLYRFSADGRMLSKTIQ